MDELRLQKVDRAQKFVFSCELAARAKFLIRGSSYTSVSCFCTLLGVPSWGRFCRQEFGEFPRLVSRRYRYLLPKQAGGPPQILVDKTSPMTDA